jgi:hypothetical protein
MSLPTVTALTSVRQKRQGNAHFLHVNVFYMEKNAYLCALFSEQQ